MATDEGIIRVRFTNIYRFPVIDANIVACLTKGTKVHILDEDDEFFKVAFSNQIAYVPKRSIGAERKTDEEMVESGRDSCAAHLRAGSDCGNRNYGDDK